MIKKLHIYIAIIAAAINFSSCSDDSADDGLLPQNSSMMLTITAPTSPNTRTSIADGDGVNMPADKAEQLKDGWAVHSLAVFITNENGAVMAGRELYIAENAPNASKVVFDLTKENVAECYGTDGNALSSTDFTLKGKNQAPPKVGNFKIYAVANYEKDSNISILVDNVIKKIKNRTEATPLPAGDKNWQNLINATLSSDASTRLCDKNSDMILTAIQDIRITVGNKEPFKMQLLRTRARLRITVRNESLRHAVQINSLTFENFTRGNTSLFPSALAAANANIDPKGATAVIPFDPNAADIPMLNDAEPAASEVTIFDGYILESEASYYTQFSSKLFRFNIGVTARTAQEGYTKYSQGNTVSDVNNGAWYMIEHEGNVLVPNKDGTLKFVTRPTDLQLNSPDVNPKDYFWVWTLVGQNNYDKWGKLQSLSNLQYISDPENHDNQLKTVRMGNTPSQNIYMQDNQFFCQMKWKQGWGNRNAFFNIWSDLMWHKENQQPSGKGGWNYIYISDESVPAKGDDTVSKTLNLSKLQNNQSFTVTEMRRNDFYHIFINIRYNDNLGHFYFEILPWTDKNLDIGFE